MLRLVFSKMGWIALLASLGACDDKTPVQDPPREQEATLGVPLGWSGEPYDLMVNDLDGDGDQDIFVIDHGKNIGLTFLQQGPRAFVMSRPFNGAGFHPGNLVAWPDGSQQYALAAEGENEVRGLLASPEGFEVKGKLPAFRPRYAAAFRWPGWGNSLAMSPYDLDEVHLLRDLKPLEGKTQATVAVPLSKRRPSAFWPGRITAADADADGWDELYFATPVTKDVFVIRPPKSKKAAPVPERIYRAPDQWGIPDEVVIADVNADARPDLLVPEYSGPGRINLLLNQGKGKFKPVQPIETLPTRGITQLKVAVDHDGSRYLVAGSYGNLAIYRFPPAWTPGQPLERRDVGWKGITHVSALVLKDVDGDGWLDAVVGRWLGESSINVLFGPLWEQFDMAAQLAKPKNDHVD